jgi:hypothetical protein
MDVVRIETGASAGGVGACVVGFEVAGLSTWSASLRWGSADAS